MTATKKRDPITLYRSALGILSRGPGTEPGEKETHRKLYESFRNHMTSVYTIRQLHTMLYFLEAYLGSKEGDDSYAHFLRLVPPGEYDQYPTCIGDNDELGE